MNLKGSSFGEHDMRLCQGYLSYLLSDFLCTKSNLIHPWRTMIIYRKFTFYNIFTNWTVSVTLWRQHRKDRGILRMNDSCPYHISWKLLRYFRMDQSEPMDSKTNGPTLPSQQTLHFVPKQRGKISCGLLVWFPCGESLSPNTPYPPSSPLSPHTTSESYA